MATVRHWRQAPHADPTPRSGSDTAAGGLRLCKWRRVPDGWDRMESVGLSWKHAGFFFPRVELLQPVDPLPLPPAPRAPGASSVLRERGV